MQHAGSRTATATLRVSAAPPIEPNADSEGPGCDKPSDHQLLNVAGASTDVPGDSPHASACAQEAGQVAGVTDPFGGDQTLQLSTDFIEVFSCFNWDSFQVRPIEVGDESLCHLLKSEPGVKLPLGT